MKTIELIGHIDDRHRLCAHVPEELPPGPVGVILLLSDQNLAGTIWEQVLAKDWADELLDSSQDIYTLEDGQPSNVAE